MVSGRLLNASGRALERPTRASRHGTSQNQRLRVCQSSAGFSASCWWDHHSSGECRGCSSTVRAPFVTIWYERLSGQCFRALIGHLRNRLFTAPRTRSTSRPATSSGRISRCGCRCTSTHEADEWILEEDPEPRPHGRALHGLVQLGADSQGAEDEPGAGVVTEAEEAHAALAEQRGDVVVPKAGAGTEWHDLLGLLTGLVYAQAVTGSSCRRWNAPRGRTDAVSGGLRRVEV